MIYTVQITPEAQAQLCKLEVDIARAGSPLTAARYVNAILDYCESLRTTPKRGTRRDDLRPGLRTVGYRRRATILFEVSDATATVSIIGIVYGGQDYETMLRDRLNS